MSLDLTVKARSFDEAMDLARRLLRTPEGDEAPKTGSWALELTRVTVPDVSDGIRGLVWIFKALPTEP